MNDRGKIIEFSPDQIYKMIQRELRFIIKYGKPRFIMVYNENDPNDLDVQIWLLNLKKDEYILIKIVSHPTWLGYEYHQYADEFRFYGLQAGKILIVAKVFSSEDAIPTHPLLFPC